jgi:uncharacterized protein GlcG (DUF336 family)
MKQILVFSLSVCLGWTGAHAQFTSKETLSHTGAESVLAAARAEAERISLPVTIAIHDASGHLLFLMRHDQAPLASIQIAQEKARTASMFGLESKQFQDWLQVNNQQRLLSLPGFILVEGGVPIMRNGRVVGSIGVSGGSSEQDAQIAKAGVAAGLAMDKK